MQYTVVEGTRKPRKTTLKRQTGKRTTAKKKSTRAKLKPLSKLKKELESLQKQLVIKLYGNDCYTCEAKDLQGSNCQLGHVPWPRTYLSVKAKFDYKYTRIQCMVCNVRRGGMGAVAFERMQKEAIDVQFLRETSDAEKGQTVPRAWFVEQIVCYKEIVDNLLITQ